nr:unnamed protein product [Callosobruchus analis]
MRKVYLQAYLDFMILLYLTDGDQVPNYDDSSNSSNVSCSDSDGEPTSTTDAKVPSEKSKLLPTPTFDSTISISTEETTSVFKNPFLEAENAKEAILQKHVKMVDVKDKIDIINGKKICWNYRKGRCRFGHNCKFAHDSDIQKTEEQIQAEKDLAVKNAVVCQNIPQMGFVLEQSELDEENGTNKKRKRPGLSQGLVPGKRVMKQYYSTRP